MGHRGMVISGMNAALTALLLLFLSGCNTTSPPAENNPLSLYTPTASNLLAGVTISGIVDTDLFLTRTRQKGPGNPGPDGTVGPPDNVPGPGGESQTEEDTDVSSDSGSAGGNVETGSGPPDGVPGPPDGTTGPPDGTTGPPDGTTGPPDGTTGPPDGVPGPPTGTPGPQNAGQGTGTGRSGGAAMSTVISQYPLVLVLEGTDSYGVPDSNGRFQVPDCPSGGYALSLYRNGDLAARRYIRLTSSHDLDLGQITGIDDDGLLICTGFDGYRFPWQDEDGDGINDLFIDTNGNGIDDLTGQAYAHGYGWQDVNADGINDLFTDADGDGINDLLPQGPSYGFTFGFIDRNEDGLNDFLQDRNGDGINDLNAIPYADGYNWQDDNKDGINDNFTDADGDGINDLTGRPVIRGYRFKFIDLDEDGINDNFADADGDGICDQGKPCEGMPYAHGYGWKDANADGINDYFTDANGDVINDLTGVRY